MPRAPKTVAKPAASAPPQAVRKAPKISPVVQALQLFEDKMTESGNEIAAILSDLTIDFDNLRTQLSALGVGESTDTPEASAPATKPKTRPQAKAPVVEEDDDVEDDEEDLLDEDDEDVEAELDEDDEEDEEDDVAAELDDEDEDEEEDDDEDDDEDEVEAELDEEDDEDDEDDWSAPPALPQTAARPKVPAAAPQRKKRPGTRR